MHITRTYVHGLASRDSSYCSCSCPLQCTYCTHNTQGTTHGCTYKGKTSCLHAGGEHRSIFRLLVSACNHQHQHDTVFMYGAADSIHWLPASCDAVRRPRTAAALPSLRSISPHALLYSGDATSGLPGRWSVCMIRWR
jgi:hypothetical protein